MQQRRFALSVSSLVPAFALLAALAAPAQAETISCPDLSTAVQVGTCPTEEDLKYTYIGYCSEDARAYRKETAVCVDYQDYRKLKNVALWETKDGRFQAYVSCDVKAEAIAAAKPVKVTIGKQTGMTRLMCGYGEGLLFTLRTRAECKVEGDGACVGNEAACKATCD